MKKYLTYILLPVMLFTMLPTSKVYAESFDEGADITDNQSEDQEDDEDGFPKLSCESAIVIDTNTGQIIYQKNAHKKMYPASITKIMTAMLAIENADLSSTITMTEDAIWGIERDSTHIALDVDEQITLESAVYATLLVSANEAAWGIADYIGGDLNGFCKMMNDKAKELGCENTHFTNANGLHDENHYTTAYDMALITKEAVSLEDFRKIASTLNYVIPPTNKNSDSRELWQDNKLLIENSDYYYKYCLGGKTGFTDEAGSTLVTWAEKNDLQLICVMLNGSYNYDDTIELYDYIFANFSKCDPLEDFEIGVEELTRAQNFLNQEFNCENLGTLKLTLEDTIPVVLPWDYDKSKFTYTFDYSSEDLKDSIIGTFTLSYNGTQYETVPIKYSGYINSKDEAAIKKAIEDGLIEKPKKHIIKRFFSFLIKLLIFVGIIYIILRYRKTQLLRLQRIRNKHANNSNDTHSRR